MAVRHRGYPKSLLLFFFWVNGGDFIPNHTTARFAWKYSYIEYLQLFTSMKILKWLQLINTLFRNLWSDIMILMDHMVSVYLYHTELFGAFPHVSCDCLLGTHSRFGGWGTVGGPWWDFWWVVALLWTTQPTPNFSTAKFKETFPRLESSFPTPIPKSVIKCWC